MNAVKLLNQKCRAVEQLFGQFQPIGQGPGKAPGFSRISAGRPRRSGSAGMVCYPEVYVSDVRSRIEKAVAELLSTQSVISDLFEMVPNDEHFDATLKALSEHAAPAPVAAEPTTEPASDASELLADAADAMSDEEHAELETQMEQLFARLAVEETVLRQLCENRGSKARLFNN